MTACRFRALHQYRDRPFVAVLTVCAIFRRAVPLRRRKVRTARITGVTVTTPQNHAPPGGVILRRPRVAFSGGAGMRILLRRACYPCRHVRPRSFRPVCKSLTPSFVPGMNGVFARRRRLFRVCVVIKSYLPARLPFSSTGCYIMQHWRGEMVEWFKAAVLKTAEAQASEGSNPSLSAIFCPTGKKHEAARLHFTRRQPHFTQKPNAFLHIFIFPEKPCLLRRSISFRL